MRTMSRYTLMLSVALGLAVLLLAPSAFAQDGWGAAATGMTGETKSIGKLFLFGGYMLGIGAVVYGLIQFIGSKKRNEPLSGSLFPLVGGTLLLAVLTVVNLTSSSVVREGAGGIEALGLGNG